MYYNGFLFLCLSLIHINFAQFINELRLDSSCTHATHGVEIAFPMSLPVDGYSIVLYNGALHTPIRTIDLSKIPLTTFSIHVSTSWKFVDVDLHDLHQPNGGTPDAIALIYNDTRVINFMSYDNTFVAKGGPADNIECKHIRKRNFSTVEHHTAITYVTSGLTCAKQKESSRHRHRHALRFTHSTYQAQEAAHIHRHHNSKDEHIGEDTSPLHIVYPIINEIQYQRVGWEVYEGVEVAAPAGTSLEGYYVVFYLARTGNVARPYRKLILGGTLRDQSNGWGFQFFRRRRTRNGPRDGLALVDNNDHVRDFVSYGGVIHAVGGPARGLVSVDIGSAEQRSNAVAYSLQRVGKGKYASDFTWKGPIPQTYGKVNTDQEFISP